MLYNLIKRKNSQIATTTTWIVATIVIIVVLSISIFATTFVLSGKKLIFIEDKEKDFLTTKSSTSFLSNEKNIELLLGDDNEKIESELNDFLDKISKEETVNPGGWNLDIVKGDEEINIYTYRVLDFRDKQFNISFNSEELKLHFWKECQGGCIR